MDLYSRAVGGGDGNGKEQAVSLPVVMQQTISIPIQMGMK